MCKKIVFFLPLAISCIFNVVHAEDIENLIYAMEVGDVALVSVTGTGGSTGLVLEGQIVNQTSDAKKLDIWLDTPLFLKIVDRGKTWSRLRYSLEAEDICQGLINVSSFP